MGDVVKEILFQPTLGSPTCLPWRSVLFELSYYESAVHRFNHYTTRTPLRIECFFFHQYEYEYESVLR